MPEKYSTFLQSLHGTQLRWRRSDPVAAVARPRREGVDGSARTLAHRRIACIHVEPRVCDRIMAFLHLTFVAFPLPPARDLCLATGLDLVSYFIAFYIIG